MYMSLLLLLLLLNNRTCPIPSVRLPYLLVWKNGRSFVPRPDTLLTWRLWPAGCGSPISMEKDANAMLPSCTPT